ncbi:unnamed protein product, partial [Ixodes persulcatus]
NVTSVTLGSVRWARTIVINNKKKRGKRSVKAAKAPKRYGRTRTAGSGSSLKMENTKHALLELLSTLSCAQCKKLLSEPHIVGLCGHTVCRLCIASAEACGICGSPTTHREVKPDHQIKNLITCTAQLKDLLFTLTPGPAVTSRTTSHNPEVEERSNNAKNERPPEQAPSEDPPPVAPSRAGSSDCRASKGTTNPVSKALEKRNKLGETMLQVAAIKGNADRVRQLLEEGADPNVRDNAGWTPLHEACNHGFREVARLLLSHGACVDVAGPGGVTPLHDATVNGHPDIVLLLVRSGATLDAKTSDGLTAQDLAQGEVMRAALCTAVPPKVVALRSEGVASGPPPVLLASGLDEAQCRDLARCAELLGSSCRSSFSEEGALVSRWRRPRCCVFQRRSLPTGVEACLRQGRRADELEHEAKGTRQHPDNGAPARARLRRASHVDRLFSGLNVVLQGPFARGPSRDDLAALLALGGACLLSRPPPADTAGVVLLVTEREGRPAQQGGRPGIFSVGAPWLLDCISKFEVNLPA